MLKIFSKPDRTKSALLVPMDIFRSRTGESPVGPGLGIINGITIGTTYAGGSNGSKLNALLSAPNEVGLMTRAVDIQFAEKEILHFGELEFIPGVPAARYSAAMKNVSNKNR